jgi:L-ascorbate metabolism protein UlaG (beta-lactamase superfamily)
MKNELKIRWIGQGGYLLSDGETEICIDPYLSDVVNRVAGRARMVEPPFAPEALKSDLVICTHDHLDHTDLPTLKQILLEATPVTILASRNAFKLVKGVCGKQHNYVLFDTGNEWTQSGVHFKAMKAVHSDEFAVGALISTAEWSIYLTGDTLYNEQVVSSVNVPVDLMFTVMNGKGNNMNAFDAARLAKRIQPKVAVPIHWGMFENYTDDPGVFCEYLKDSNIRSYIPDFFKTETVENLIAKD